MMQRYLKFIKRSLHTHEHDIVQPYHKIIDLCFKVVSLGFAFAGAYLLVTTPLCIFSPSIAQKYCASLSADASNAPLFTAGADYGYFLMRWLTGAGYMLITIFLSQVLVVRYLGETLPDHIYLRCFATEEEKAKRLPIRQARKADR